MEYTKDIMFHIKYAQDENVIRLNKEDKQISIRAFLKKYKFITIMLFLGILLIVTDIFLINSFINILRQF
ncbi:MAG TPA: hypothetical protein OIM45_05405 [Clostridiaceae bacterium]|jgi:hypothetical protein|nr:hypothetical protein [Clostridiaceae bacterium]